MSFFSMFKLKPERVFKEIKKPERENIAVFYEGKDALVERFKASTHLLREDEIFKPFNLSNKNLFYGATGAGKTVRMIQF